MSKKLKPMFPYGELSFGGCSNYDAIGEVRSFPLIWKKQEGEEEYFLVRYGMRTQKWDLIKAKDGQGNLNE